MDLVKKLLDRSISSRELDELRKLLLPMGRHLAKKLCNSRDVEEYESAAYHGIAYALHHAADKMHDDNLEKWVASCIIRFVRRLRVTNHLVRIPDQTLRDYKKRGKSFEFLKGNSLGDYPKSKSRCSEILESLEEASRGLEDRIIIELRLKGFTDGEIAEKIGKTRTHVYRRRMLIESRFNTLEAA